MRVAIHPGDLEAARLGMRRSSEWPRVERAHLLMQPRCICCAPEMHPHASVQVHHLFPFHFCVALGRPDLELDPRNLVTLCEDAPGRSAENHHLLVGHLDSFQSSNLTALDDARETFHGLRAPQIRSDARWLKAVSARIRPLDQMSASEREAFAARMNRSLPKK